MSAENKIEKLSPTKKQNKFLRILLVGFLVIIVFFALFSLMIQWSPIQNYLVDKVTKNLENKWESNIDIGKINLSFFNGLELDHLYVEDTYEDTLLYAKNVSISLTKNLFSAISKKYFLNEVELSDVQFFLTTYAGEEKNNLELLLQRIRENTAEESEETETPKPLLLELNVLHLNRVEFVQKI